MTPLALAALLAAALPTAARADHNPQGHPDVAVRIDQALLETDAVLEAQRQAHGGKVRDFRLQIKEDGFHATGKYRVPILPDIGFEAVISVVWTAPNEFEIRTKKLTILGFINVTTQVIEGVESGLKEALPGALTFQRLGERPDGSQALKVTVDMKALLPSLPNLYLSGITTREKVLILKAQLS